ncbi:MAG: hypothetical protein ACF8GE_00350 [Phycisphaerales bacterium JB043]
MAIEQQTLSRISDLTNAHWDEHVHDAGFTELAQGKEIGHRIADYVDDRTTSLLKVHLDTRWEGDGNGEIKKRSMGDVWVYSNGIFNPINIKSGLQDMSGQPNVVSMQKLLNYIFNRWIDSYYLLIIKFNISKSISHKTYLIDLLDWTEFITYNAGPGQIMLREQEFYETADNEYVPPARSIQEKIDSLFNLFESQVASLIRQRTARLEAQRRMLEQFKQDAFVVDQSSLQFVP